MAQHEKRFGVWTSLFAPLLFVACRDPGLTNIAVPDLPADATHFALVFEGSERPLAVSPLLTRTTLNAPAEGEWSNTID